MLKFPERPKTIEEVYKEFVESKYYDEACEAIGSVIEVTKKLNKDEQLLLLGTLVTSIGNEIKTHSQGLGEIFCNYGDTLILLSLSKED